MVITQFSVLTLHQFTFPSSCYYLDCLWIQKYLKYVVQYGSFENEALENEDQSTKHPKLENEAPKIRKRSTQISKTKHPKLENEAPKSRKRSTQKLENEVP